MSTEPWREAWERIVNRPCNDTAEERRFAAAFAAGDSNGYARALDLPELGEVLEKAESTRQWFTVGDPECGATANRSEAILNELFDSLAAFKARMGME